MASFTDNLPQYTPYVAQLPVQAMKEVGMYKQQQYNEGVQKIQGQVDDIAGLDVIRDVDKQYLQSRLNDLGNNLKKVAGGDFSNYQLVNSVGGMTKQIVKDKNIQNAVASTMRYRKGVADMDAAKKEGKSAPSNEWDFQTQASDWLNNSDINSSFSGGYNPYTNYKKNALDIIKSLTKDDSITDDAFKVNPDGSLTIYDAMTRKKLAGIDPGKVQQALMATLTPADFKQMEIDGRYTYSNVSPEVFSQNLKSSYKSKVDFYTDQKKKLEGGKSSTQSALEKGKLDEQIASLDKIIDGVGNEQKQMEDALTHGNIEGVKAQLHTSDFLNNFSKAFSYTEISNTYQTNPFVQPAQWRAEQDRDWKKFILNYEQKNRELDLKKKELGPTYGGLGSTVDQSLLPQLTIYKVVEKTKQDENSLNSLDIGFLNNKKKDENWFKQQREAWERSPNSVEAEVALHLAGTELLRRGVESNKAMLIDAQQAAGKALGIGDPSEYINKLIPKNAPDVQYSDGKVQFTYKPKDFVDYNSALSKYVSSGAYGGVLYDFKKAKEELSPKLYHLLEIQAGKQPLTDNNKQLLGVTQDYQQIVNTPNREILSKIDDLSQEELRNRLTSNQGVDYNIPTPKPEQQKAVGNILSRFATIAEAQKGKLPGSPDFNADDAKKLASNPDTQYALKVVEGGEFQTPMYEMTASGMIGDKLVSTKAFISPEQKAQVFGQQFEADPRVQAIRPYQAQIRKMGGYSTALSPGDSNHENAYLSSVDFPYVSRYGIKANIIKSPSNQYQFKLSIFDPVDKKWHENIPYPRKGMLFENALYDAMIGLTDTELYERLHETPATENDLKQVEKSAQKPF